MLACGIRSHPEKVDASDWGVLALALGEVEEPVKGMDAAPGAVVEIQLQFLLGRVRGDGPLDKLFLFFGDNNGDFLRLRGDEFCWHGFLLVKLTP
jgi:hypothetical protein